MFDVSVSPNNSLKYKIIVFNFVMASTAKCISERRAQLIQQWIPSVLMLAAQSNRPQLYEVTGAPAGSNSDKHHLCFISFFSFFLNNILSKNKDFPPPTPDLYWNFYLFLDKRLLWNPSAVKSKLEWLLGWVFPGWVRFNNDRNFIYCIYTWLEK